MNRPLITGLLLGMLSLNAPAMQKKQYAFRVFLGEQEIGQHEFSISAYGDKTYVTSKADFDVKFLFFTAYNYAHNNSEIWKAGCLQAINASTDDNGDSLYVRGEYQQQSLQLQTHNGSQQLTGCTRSFAYWNPQLLTSNQLLNTQTGELEQVNIESLGETTLQQDGMQLRARQLRISNDSLRIDLWYSKNNEWLALQSTTSTGQPLRYLRQFSARGAEK